MRCNHTLFSCNLNLLALTGFLFDGYDFGFICFLNRTVLSFTLELFSANVRLGFPCGYDWYFTFILTIFPCSYLWLFLRRMRRRKLFVSSSRRLYQNLFAYFLNFRFFLSGLGFRLYIFVVGLNPIAISLRLSFLQPRNIFFRGTTIILFYFPWWRLDLLGHNRTLVAHIVESDII